MSNGPVRTATADASRVSQIEAVASELVALRASMMRSQASMDLWIRNVEAMHTASAVNLAHYLAMRRVDLRPLQARLARLGLSSLGRAEAHVLASVDKVLAALSQMSGTAAAVPLDEGTARLADCGELLARHAELLFGPPPPERQVRIMVTLPSAAAHDQGLVHTLVSTGMDVARINCAHDSAVEWEQMAENVTRAAGDVGRPVKILMDLAGPKLRTGPIDSGPAVLKLKPKRDAYGRVVTPARLGLRVAGSTVVVHGIESWVGVDADWLHRLEVGDRIDMVDARFSKRSLEVSECMSGAVIVDCQRTAYLTESTTLGLHSGKEKKVETRLFDVPALPGLLHLHRGDTLRLLPVGSGHEAVLPAKGSSGQPACVVCTLPEALPQLRKGDHVWFDDGRIGSVVQHVADGGVDLEITAARDDGEHLAADKGINFPDTSLELRALTDKDLGDIVAVAQLADIVGMSFAQSADDVRALRERLNELGANDVGMILKIETKSGFERLPDMLFAAMTGPAAGVMIARGDLAVQCGYERVAEVQEEIMWACEAAHTPVVWATQVLETLAKTGLPSRAEVTDAAMGGRAECVMLNKGPHIGEAIRALDDILQRMQGHQSKKQSLLRALTSWGAMPGQQSVDTD